jgi:hypothetical protein
MSCESADDLVGSDLGVLLVQRGEVYAASLDGGNARVLQLPRSKVLEMVFA